MTNRIVVDCFYFTQAITLSLLGHFNSSPSTLGGFTHSAPVNYHGDQRFIVNECCCTDPKLFVNCLTCIYYNSIALSCHYILAKLLKYILDAGDRFELSMLRAYETGVVAALPA